MTWFSRYLQRYSKLASNAPRLRLSDIKNVKHELDWPLLVTMYDLRMWFLQRSKAVGRKSQLLGSIENLHNDLNYLWARRKVHLYSLPPFRSGSDLRAHQAHSNLLHRDETVSGSLA